MIPANSHYTYRDPLHPIWFATGIQVAAVTGGADSDATAPGTLPIIELEYA